MPLITVYFPKFKVADGELPYRKAFINPEDSDFFFKLGAVSTPSQLPKGYDDNGMREEIKNEQTQEITAENNEPTQPDEKIQGVIADPDKGHGEPGSYRFHEQQILSLSNVDQVNGYLESVTGQGFDRPLSTLGYAKTKALTLIKEHLGHDDSQNP